ncbi:hypothetical protein PRIC2_012261 [Phytophthora ramorum]
MNFLLEESDAQFLFSDPLDFDEQIWPLAQERPAAANDPERKKRRPRRDPEAGPTKRTRATTPRLRNKGKIELLRREIESLEAEVKVLLLSKARPSIRAAAPTIKCPSEPTWKSIAMRQSQERERAEFRNRGLKSMLSAQHMLTMSLSGVLNEWRSLSSPDSSLRTCV